MTKEGQPRVLLFGAGSVGAVYLYLLSKQSNITAVCRSNFDFVKQNGFTLNSAVFGQNIRFIPNVVRDCAEAVSTDPTPFDFIVVCSKAIPSTIPAIIAPAVKPGHTAIVLVQNGIGIEEEYVTAFPENPIVSCVVYLPATQRPQGTVEHGNAERLEIGPYPSTASDASAKAFADLLRASGGTAELYGDVQLKRWYKLIVNASWNPICALTLSTDVAFMTSSPASIDLVFHTMLETAEIAGAYGYRISREEVEHQLARAKARVGTTGIEPSMLADVREGRKMEVEAIVGNTVRLAREKGVECIRLETLYALTKALDVQVSSRK